MLIQPKRWVAPTAGALLVLLVLGMLWGRHNPDQMERFSSHLPAWHYGGAGSTFVKSQPPAGLAPPVDDKKPAAATSTPAAAADSAGSSFNTNPEYVENAVPGVPDAGHALDPMIPPVQTTSTEISPFKDAVPTSTTQAAGMGEVVGGGRLGEALAAVAPTSSSSVPAAAPTYKGVVLEPIRRPPPPPPSPDQVVASDLHPVGTHNVIRSRSTKDGKYFIVDFWGLRSYNPNLIPHPLRPDTWMVTTQRWKGPDDNQVWFTQLICDAVWVNGTLKCEESPLILPVAASVSEKCVDELVYFNLNVGPHDARAFYGPDVPYLVYGTQSQFTCFGQYIQDFRVLTDWGLISDAPFRFPTDVQRPGNYGPVEKNWFVFWDKYNESYVHYDVKPHRVFAKLNLDGSVGKDIGLQNRAKDDECLARHTANVEESVRKSLHQATNSLMVTMCKRSDPTCKPTDDNTFVLSIFQQKSFNMFHGIYEPYVMLFKRTAPFETYAFGKKPIWTMGRNMPGELSVYRQIPSDQSEMVYLTSLNWKQNGVNYHGYLDDVIFVGFGVEDSVPAVIDVTAEDLIGDIMKC